MTQPSVRSVESNTAAGSHHRCRPLRGRWHRVADTMMEGVVRPARTAWVCFAVNDALRSGSNLISHAHIMLRLYHGVGWRVTAVSPAGSVGASACGRGCHRQPAPRLRGSQGIPRSTRRAGGYNKRQGSIATHGSAAAMINYQFSILNS